MSGIFCMKHLMITLATVCCSIVAIAQDAQESENDPLNAVVRIEAVSTVPSYSLP